MRSLSSVLVLIAAPLSAAAQTPPMTLVPGPDAVKWGPAPPALPKGAMMAVLSGDPTKSGPFVARLKFPANYSVPAHHHPTAEGLTILSGSFHAGMGDKLDTKTGQAIAPGGFALLPAGMNHYGWTTAETVLQVNSDGPFAIQYVDPNDDPSKKP